MADDTPTAFEMIYMLRGGWSDTCDFCGEKVGEENIHPEEAGQWVCTGCAVRWAKEDDDKKRGNWG